MSRFVVTQKGQPSAYIAEMARLNTTPRGQVNPVPQQGTYGHYAAEQFGDPQVLLSGGGLGALDIDIEQAPLYRVPSAAAVIRSAFDHPTNYGTRVHGESLGSALSRARRFYF